MTIHEEIDMDPTHEEQGIGDMVADVIVGGNEEEYKSD